MDKGKVLHVCLSEAKGTVKASVGTATLIAQHGFEGDAHAGPGHRQVSLLDAADIDTMRAKGIELKPGAFGENLVVGGLNLNRLGIGSRLRIGSAEIEITQIGKVCHNRCEIYYRTGDCIMPRMGVFASVIHGGEVFADDEIEVVEALPRAKTQVAVLTVSDRCAAGITVDEAGPAVAGIAARELEAHVAWTGVVPDEKNQIVETLRNVAGRHVDLLFTVGGTGCGPRDVTPDATRTVITREVPGLSEAMRSASARVTPHALLQRGICGIYEGTLIVNLPGSEKAASENLGAIVTALPHAVRQLRGVDDHVDPRRATAGQPSLGNTLPLAGKA